MTTDESAPLLEEQRPAPARAGGGRGSLGSWLAGIGLLAFVGLFLVVSRTALDPRVANPNTEGRPRPVEYLLGIDNWMLWVQLGTALMLVQLVVMFIIGWRRNPGSPVMLMILCTTLIVWQDPIMNWAPFAVYNPDLLHWPESWPLVMM